MEKFIVWQPDKQIELDHELIWLDIDFATSNLYLKNQQQAVRIFKDLSN